MEHRRPLLVLITISGLLASSCALSEIYRWVDDNGKVQFSDRPSAAHAVDRVEVRVNTYQSTSYETSDVDVGQEVVMYSADWCGVCKKARRYFRENGVPFTEYDVETSAKGKAGYRKLRGKGVPIILVGKQRMNGFSAKGFERLYQ